MYAYKDSMKPEKSEDSRLFRLTTIMTFCVTIDNNFFYWVFCLAKIIRYTWPLLGQKQVQNKRQDPYLILTRKARYPSRCTFFLSTLSLTNSFQLSTELGVVWTNQRGHTYTVFSLRMGLRTVGCISCLCNAGVPGGLVGVSACLSRYISWVQVSPSACSYIGTFSCIING